MRFRIKWTSPTECRGVRSSKQRRRPRTGRRRAADACQRGFLRRPLPRIEHERIEARQTIRRVSLHILTPARDLSHQHQLRIPARRRPTAQVASRRSPRRQTLPAPTRVRNSALKSALMRDQRLLKPNRASNRPSRAASRSARSSSCSSLRRWQAHGRGQDCCSVGTRARTNGQL